MPKGAVKYIVGGSLVLLGIILMVIASCIGGAAVFTNGVHFDWGNNDVYVNWTGIHITPNYHTAWEDSTVGNIENIKNLKVNFDYGEMIIKTGDVDEIKVETQNITQNSLKCEVRGDTLEVEHNSGWRVHFFGFSFSGNNRIEITVPETMTFEKVEIENGAGKMTLTGITADSLTIENGAGEMIVNSTTVAGKLDIDGGVGAITVNDTVCGGIEADIGVGEFRYTGEVNGNGKIDSGVGAVYMTLYGDRDDYDFKTDSGIGSITTPGSNSGAKYIFSISSGIGEVKITMEKGYKS